MTQSTTKNATQDVPAPAKPPESVFGAPINYTQWDVEITMKDRLYGGVPSNPKVIEGWIRTNMTQEDDRVHAMVIRTLQERGYAPEEMSWDEIEDELESLAATLNQDGFKRDEHGLYIEGRQCMAMLRESVSVLFTGIQWKRRNGAKSTKSGESMLKASRSLFRESVHVPEARVYLGRDEEDGVELKIVHPSDPNRESSLSYVEYVENAVLNFTVEELHGTVPGEDGWKGIWQTAERNGLGAMRSQQHGKFFVTRWEKI